MCISALVLAGISLAASAAGTVASVSSANANAGAQQQQLGIQQQQLAEDMQLERLKASQAEVARLGDFRRQRAANVVAIAGSGVGENMSFLQGIVPAENRALGTDLANIRLGLLGSENRLTDEIRVNRLNSAIVDSNAGAQKLAAGINLVGSAAQAASYYQTYKVPGAGSTKIGRLGASTVGGTMIGAGRSLIGGY